MLYRTGVAAVVAPWIIVCNLIVLVASIWFLKIAFELLLMFQHQLTLPAKNGGVAETAVVAFESNVFTESSDMTCCLETFKTHPRPLKDLNSLSKRQV